jgi:phosphate transport system permease protein
VETGGAIEARRRREGIESGEIAFRRLLYVTALAILVLLAAIFLTLLVDSLPSIRALGLKFLYGRTWDPVGGSYGTLPFLLGTLATSFLALAVSVPFSLAISIFLGEYFRDGALSGFLKSAIDLLAGIPSVIYGFWGLLVLVPVVRGLQAKLGVAPFGVGIFTSALVLAVMIVPYAAALGREVIQLVPGDLKEAGLSLGATRYEIIRKIVLPYARSGILAGVVLALGRAIGETMAVTMVIGNSNLIPKSIFSPANTMASVIANEFVEATDKIYVSSLIQVGLVLFLVTTVVNIVGRHVIRKVSVDI